MNKLFILLLAATLISCNNGLDPAPVVDKHTPTDIDMSTAEFRRGRWGDHYEDIIYRENKVGQEAIYKGRDYLAYEGSGSTDYYYFDRAKLTGGDRFMDRNYSNKNQYIEDYTAVKNSMMQKHGTPTETIWWVNETVKAAYQDKPEQWGTAVSQGLLSYEARWEKERATLYLVLEGKDNQITYAEMHYAK